MATTVVVRHNAVPPSANTNTGVGGRGKPQAIGKTKGEWEGLFAKMLMEAKVPRHLSLVKVRAELQFRDKRRRDLDNFHFPISKPLGDALVKGGWLKDDTPDHFVFEGVTMSKERLEHPLPTVKGKLTLTITYE